jgi:hypothetical protein
MTTAVRHFITVGDKTVELTPDEARVVTEGEIPRGMVKRLAEYGINLPQRGTVTYHHEIQFGDRIIRTEAHMRRMPTWDRREAA